MKKITTAIVALMLTYSAAAQEYNRHEFSVNAGGGVSSFQNQPTVGKNFWNWTGTAGLGYHYFFSQKWGIGTGANFAIYNGGISINNYNQQQAAINRLTGNAFDFLVTSTDYKEKQQAMMVTIPLMLQHQAKGDRAPYAAIGVKAGIPVVGKSKSKGNFTTKGFFPDLNVTYEDLPDYGFVNDQPFPNNKTDINLKTVFMASAEAGVKWRLSENKSLYTGIYADYGLNNILEKETSANTNLVVYQSNTPAQFAYNTATNSYAKKMSPLAVGVTVRLAFGSGKSSPAPTPTPIPVASAQIVEEPETEDNSLAEQEEQLRLLAEAEELRKAEEERLAQEEAQRLADEEAKRIARENAIHNLEEPIKNYVLNQTVANNPQRNELDEKVAILNAFPDIKFRIFGHTCPIGTREANQRVGMARAADAKRYLILQGIDEIRILGIDTKRDTEPLVPNDTEANRRINRRVQLIVDK
jgi:outer membrane protein OmpA-like peptidoglycan-associated protein